MKKAQHTRKARAVPPSLAGEARSPRSAKPHSCVVKTKSGGPCGAPPLAGTRKCIMHSGRNAVVLGSKGGHRRAIFSPEGLMPFDAPKTAADLRDLLAQSIVEIRGGKLDPKLANSISYLGAGFLKSLEVSDLEARLTALERPRNGEDR